MNGSKHYAPWLWLLLALFCFRVAAQPLARTGAASFLPSFDTWHSALLPYAWLLAAQILIIIVFAWTAWRFTRGDVTPHSRLGWFLFVLGAIYFGVMLVRLALGLTVLSSHPWFGKTLPAFFHLVLASFLLLVGRFHIQASGHKAR